MISHKLIRPEVLKEEARKESAGTIKLSVSVPFSGEDPVVSVLPCPNKSLGELFPYDVVDRCLLNGVEVEPWQEVKFENRDHVEIFLYPQAAALVPLFIGIGFSIAAAEVAAFIAALVIQAAILAGLGLALNALTPKPKTGFNPLGGNTSRPEEAFGVGGLRNTIAPGTPAWVPYGERRVWGHVISSYTTVSRDGESMSFGVLYFMGDTGGDTIEDISDVQLNGTPIADFEGASFEWRNGALDQSVISGFSDVSQAYGVFQSLVYNTPFVYTSNSTQATRFKIILNWPGGLRRVNDQGEDLAGKSTIRIEYKVFGAGSWLLYEDFNLEVMSLSGIFRERDVIVGSANQWELRFTEVHDPNSTDPPNINPAAQLFNIQEIEDTTLNYPGEALLAIHGVSSAQIQSIGSLECSALMKGKKCLVWNGSSDTLQYTQKRAWILRDMMTNPKVGLGHRIPDALFDKDAALDIQTNVWDVQVPGYSGNEVMDRCDVLINERRKGWDWLKDISADGRASFISSQGKHVLICQYSQTPGVRYSIPGRNTVEGTLKRELGRGEATINVVQGQFPDDDKENHQQVVEVVDSAIGSDPRKVKAFTFLSVTRESQVYRELEFYLRTAIFIKRRFQFTATRAAIYQRPWDVCQLSYPTYKTLRGSSGFCGNDSTTTEIYLQDSITLESGKTYECLVQRLDNTKGTAIVSTGPGTWGKVSLASPLAFTPTRNDIYSIGEQDVAILPVLIESMKYREDGNIDLSVAEYNDQVFSTDPLPSRTQRKYFRVPNFPPIPFADATVMERVRRNKDGSFRSTVAFSVTPGLLESAGTVQAATANTVDLETSEPNTTNHWLYAIIEIYEGTGSGQSREISAYDGTNRRCTVLAWTIIPDGTSKYRLSRTKKEPLYGFSLDFSTISITGPWTFITDVQGFMYEQGVGGASRQIWYRFTPLSKLGVRNDRAKVVRDLTIQGDLSAPDPPSGVTGNGAAFQATLKWTNASAEDLAAVEIYRSETNDRSTSQKVGEVAAPGTTFLDDPLSAPTTFYYWLRSRDHSGNQGAFHTGDLNGLSVTTKTFGQDDPAPATPTGLTLQTSGTILDDGTFQSEILATWAPNVESNLSLYRLRYKKQSTPANEWIATVSVPAGIERYIFYVEAGVTYDVQIQAVSQLSNPSAWSASQSITATDSVTAPSAPTGVAVTAFPLALVVSWNANPERDIQEYEVQRAEDSGFTVNVVTVFRGITGWFRDDLGPQTTRYYRVRAHRKSTNTPPSAWSAHASGTTLFIDTDEIAPGAIEVPNFGTGLKPIYEVNGLPDPSTMPDNAVVIDISDPDRPIYRNVAQTSWTRVVPVIDLQGQVDNTQIVDDAVTATKVATGAITEVKIQDAAVTTPKLDSLAVTEEKVADAAIAVAKLQDSAVTTDKIAIDAVTTAKIAPQAVDTAALADLAISTSKIQAGAITTTEISSDAITTPKIAAGAVDVNKLSANSVDASKIQALAVTAGKIAADAVTANEIAANAVTAGKIAANAVTATEIAAGTITANEISSGAITADKLAANSVSTAALQADSVTAGKLAAGSVVAGDIAAGAVTATEIAAGTITSAEIAADTINAGNIAAGAIGADEIAANAVVAGKIAADAVTANEIAANAVTSVKINALAVTTAKLDALAVTTEKINALAVTAAKIAAGAVEADKIAANAITAGKIAADAVTSGTIAAGAVIATKIGAGVIDATHLTTGSAVITNAAQIQNLLVATAHIKDLNVTTIKIGNNAVTNKGTAENNGFIQYGTGTWTDLLSITMSFSSSTNVLLIGRANCYVTSGLGNNSQVRLLRSPSTVIDVVLQDINTQSKTQLLMGLDTPGSGSHTYKLQALKDAGASNDHYAEYRNIIVTEYIK